VKNILKLVFNTFKRKSVLVVCTGNTCRSPMGAALLRKKIGFFGRLKYRVHSAGVSTSGGSPVSENAVVAMKKRGINIKRYNSTKLTQQMVDEAFVVFGMTDSHCRQIKDRFGFVCHPFSVFDDIADPYGGNLNEYEETATQIEKAADFRSLYLAAI